VDVRVAAFTVGLDVFTDELDGFTVELDGFTVELDALKDGLHAVTFRLEFGASMLLWMLRSTYG
jgi:hypothetical protein